MNNAETNTSKLKIQVAILAILSLRSYQQSPPLTVAKST
jgi:hypothetical protein